MARNKKIKTDEIVKTFSFKVKSCSKMAEVKNTLLYYNTCYNRLSSWIAESLTTMTIGDMTRNISDEKKRRSVYYKAGTDPLWENRPLYEIFTKKFSVRDNFSVEGIGNKNNVDNILITATDKINPEGYIGNPLGLSKSYFRTFGYATEVVSNYKTKIVTMKPNVKKYNIDETSDDETKMVQVIYEICNNGRTSIGEFDEYIRYLKQKENPNEKLISRLVILRDYYKSHESEVVSRIETQSILSLAEFGGCKKSSLNGAMKINGVKYTIEKKTNCNGYVLAIKLGRRESLVFDLWGRKDTIRDFSEIVGVCTRHGESLTIKMGGDGSLYIDIPVNVPFVKGTPSKHKSVGIDVNTKHMLLATDVIDNGKIKGYINLYKAIVEDDVLKSLIGENKNDYELLNDMSSYVNFCPIEYDSLLSRIFDDNEKMKLVEDRITSLFKEIVNKTNDNKVKIYVGTVLKFRSQLKRLMYLKKVYGEEQRKYDIKMGFVDESTEGRDKMDKRRWEIPFIKDAVGERLYKEMCLVIERLCGQRDCIAAYAYQTLRGNGYNTFVMENLTSSSFGNTRLSFPTINSLLKYHKFLGKRIDEISNSEIYRKHSNKYRLHKDEDGVIVNAEYSDKAKLMINKTRARDYIIKAIHFAEMKDVFMKYTNNDIASVVLVPSYYTSQMDSERHTLYMSKNKNGKLSIIDKGHIRSSQEKHINGLNADYNGAVNINHIFNDTKWRSVFLKKNKKYGYSNALLVPAVKSQSGMVAGLKKMGAITIIE